MIVFEIANLILEYYQNRHFKLPILTNNADFSKKIQFKWLLYVLKSHSLSYNF